MTADMGSDRRMCCTQLWLTAFLVVSSLTSLTDGSPLKVMSAPNLLRVGTAENVFVECQDCTGGDIRVEINVMNYPTKTRALFSTSVTLTRAKGFQAFGEIHIPADDFNKDPNMKQYVYLQAQFPDRLLEKVVLVSFQSGYIFIQTDKTLYTPNSRVYYRMFALSPRMEPVDRDDQTQSDASIAIDIVTPQGIVLPSDPVSLRSGMHYGSFTLDETASPGLWKVVTKFRSNPQQSYSAEFEVQNYVLPSFEVKLTTVSPFFYVDSEELTVNIKATYLFGEGVQGTAYVVFGVIQYGQKKSFPSSLQRVQITNGIGAVTLRREHITHTFNNIRDLVGSSIFVSVSVLTETGSEMVEAQSSDIHIITSPYTINFKKTPKYYKPGLTFAVTVEVVTPDGSPAKGVDVVVDPGQVRGLTGANGMARLNINTMKNTQQLIIAAKTQDPRVPLRRQTSATMVAHPQATPNNNYLHLDVAGGEKIVGETLKVQLVLSNPENSLKHITYLILSRGRLMQHGHRLAMRQTVIYLDVPITKEMLPSFRIVAYYHTDNQVVSDSIWVDVKDSCSGLLKLESAGPVAVNRPRRMFSLKITGDPSATVALLSVDKGSSLHNKHPLTQKKIWDFVEKYDTGCTPGSGKDSMSVFYDAGLLFESTASGTPHRLDVECPGSSRRKRATTSEGEDNRYMDSNEIVSRSKFPESWLWIDVKLPACPRQTPNCDSTSYVKHFPLQDSITTWQFTAISMSRVHGICVADPLEVVVRKPFFIDLITPHSAVRGEQLEIKAILHNYNPDPVIVRVELLEENDVCSAAYKRGKYGQVVEVGPQSTRSVPFIIIPMKEGDFLIGVQAAVRDSVVHDGVRKRLWVVPRGILIKSTKTVTLDPMEGVNGIQETTLNSGIPLKAIVPNTPVVTHISLTGRQPSSLLESPISGFSMDDLIIKPSGSGEQIMIEMTLPVIATIYLDKTNQWETVGIENRTKALQYILSGYHNQLRYRKSDGSFAVFSHHPSSTWLTAYVAKVFAMSANLVSVQTNIVCDAIKFLLLNTQQPDGRFTEVGTIVEAQMTGDVRGTDSDASMTAFCLIAMQESYRLCAPTVNYLPVSVQKAAAYLEGRLPALTNPYAIAMTSYALASYDKPFQEKLFNSASPDSSHWPVAKGQVYTLEATAYALLALLKAKAYDKARPVFRWFNQQPKVNGGYGSTQATLMVYQALTEYWISDRDPYDLNVFIMLPRLSRVQKFNFNKENYYHTRTTKIVDSINQDIRVTAKGQGEATLTMVSMYYTLPTENEGDCQKFNLSVQLIPENLEVDEKIYKLTIVFFYKDTRRDAIMSVLDIGLLTGFTVNTKDLDLLSSTRTISKYEVNNPLSDRGSLIIYLDKVSHTQPEEITFRIHQKIKVGVLQPATVSIYEYYDQTSCVRYYHKEQGGEQLQLCTNDVCTCAEETCGVQKKAEISSSERIAALCDSTLTGRKGFAYKVRVETFTDGSSTDIYTMRIVDVIKEGSKDIGSQGKLRTFLSYRHCRDVLDMKQGKTYLVMGSSRDVNKNTHSQSYQYSFSEGTWIEYWPTEAECQTESHRRACTAMEELSTDFQFFGCPL